MPYFICINPVIVCNEVIIVINENVFVIMQLILMLVDMSNISIYGTLKKFALMITAFTIEFSIVGLTFLLSYSVGIQISTGNYFNIKSLCYVSVF